MIGFDEAFDTSVSADMTIIEETNELVERLEKRRDANYPAVHLLLPGMGPLCGERKHPELHAVHLHQQVPAWKCSAPFSKEY